MEYHASWDINIHKLADAKVGLYHLGLDCWVQHTLCRNYCPIMYQPQPRMVYNSKFRLQLPLQKNTGN